MDADEPLLLVAADTRNSVKAAVFDNSMGFEPETQSTAASDDADTGEGGMAAQVDLQAAHERVYWCTDLHQCNIFESQRTGSDDDGSGTLHAQRRAAVAMRRRRVGK